MADALIQLMDILDDETAEEVSFICQMAGITPSEFIKNAVNNHIQDRLALPEFGVQIGRHMDGLSEVAQRLTTKSAVKRRQISKDSK